MEYMVTCVGDFTHVHKMTPANAFSFLRKFKGLDFLSDCYDVEHSQSIDDVAGILMTAHAIPQNEVTDAYHIATAAYYGMDVLLTWNCKHVANEFTLPKTYGVLKDAGLKRPVIITPKRYMEDEHGIRDTNG